MDTLIDRDAQIVLYNLKAKKKIKRIEENVDIFDKEIKESMDKCDELFNKYNADINYLSELMEVENDLQNENSKRHSSSESLLAKKDSILEELKEFQSKLPLTAKEDLSFLMKKINDRQKREDDNLQELKQIEELYPNAREYDVKAAYTIFPFSAIKLYLHPEEMAETGIEVEEESIVTAAPHNMPYVVSIKKYNEPVEDSEPETDSPLDEKLSAETESDNTFFESGDKLTSAINNNVTAPEVTKEEETSVLLAPGIEENTDIIAPIETSFDEVVSPLNSIEESTPLEDKITQIEEAPEEEVSVIPETPVIVEEPKEEVKEEPKEETPKEPETNEVKYTLEEGLSLSDLALALCEDSEGWNDIYKANKTAIEERLKENHINDLNDIENNTEIFKGLELIIPNEFTKEKIER